MLSAIIAGIPMDAERRVRSALKAGSIRLASEWRVEWIRSKARSAGVAPSQIDEIRQLASQLDGAHVLAFRGAMTKDHQLLVLQQVPAFFRFRWLDDELISRVFARELDEFADRLSEILAEELSWSDTIKPRDESCCLLLPQCAFAADSRVRHVWDLCKKAGAQHVEGARRAMQTFRQTHWVPATEAAHYRGPRAWTDVEGRVFDHRGQRHGPAPFPRDWKFSYRVPTGFHYDVKSDRDFHVLAWDNTRHNAIGGAHINMDVHGYVR